MKQRKESSELDFYGGEESQYRFDTPVEFSPTHCPESREQSTTRPISPFETGRKHFKQTLKNKKTEKLKVPFYLYDPFMFDSESETQNPDFGDIEDILKGEIPQMTFINGPGPKFDKSSSVSLLDIINFEKSAAVLAAKRRLKKY